MQTLSPLTQLNQSPRLNLSPPFLNHPKTKVCSAPDCSHFQSFAYESSGLSDGESHWVLAIIDMLGASPGTRRTVAARGVRAASGHQPCEAHPVGGDFCEEHWCSLVLFLEVDSPSTSPSKQLG